MVTAALSMGSAGAPRSTALPDVSLRSVLVRLLLLRLCLPLLLRLRRARRPRVICVLLLLLLVGARSSCLVSFCEMHNAERDVWP
jgi:hypothetical protein